MILCSQEKYDSVLGIPRPNCSSESWYIKELGILKPPFTLGNWNIIDPSRQMFSKKDLINQSQEVIPSLFYTPIEQLNNKPHLYIIKINNPNFFELNEKLGFSVIDKKVIQDVNNGKSAIVLINSWEGYSGSSGNRDLEILNQWCINFTFNPNNVFYIQGNLLIEKFVNERNYNFTGVGLSSFEGWLQLLAHSDNDFRLGLKREYKKLFLSYNKRPRPHRTDLIALLFKHSLLESGMISFFASNVENPVNSILKDEEWKELNNKIPLLVDEESKEENPAMQISFTNHRDTFVSVISETLVTDDTLFISEKTWKPIFIGHPFLIYGNKHTLKYLRGRGYKTFSKWWDESYDNLDNYLDRLNEIIKILKKLQSKSIKELQQLNVEMQPVLEHNKKLFLEDLTNLFNYPNDIYSKELENHLFNIYGKLR